MGNREFWLDIEKGTIYFSFVKGATHVIEKSRADELAKALDGALKELQFLGREDDDDVMIEGNAALKKYRGEK